MTKDIAKGLLAILAVLAITYGLAAARPDRPLTPSAPFTGQAHGTPARASAAGGRVIMHVNGEPVTEAEFGAFMTQAPEQMQMLYQSPEGRRLLAQEFVKLKVLEQEGRRLGIEHDANVATRLEMDRINVMAGSTLRKLVSKPSEARLRAEYEKEKGRLSAKDISHILIAYEGGAVPGRGGKVRTLAQAGAYASRIAQRAKAGGNFADLARSESDDVQSAQAGGFLGPIADGALPPELNAVVMSLQPGQVSDPVRSQFGVHVFKAGQAKSQPYEQVRDTLAAQIQRQEAEAAMARLEKTARVELDPKFFPPAQQQGVRPRTP